MDDTYKPDGLPPNLLSVVVPAYNVEDYLAECLDSLIAQTYDELEILVVVDGATDGTLEIARNYERRDQRIRVIDQPNGGLSNARNNGLAVARGDYIAFLDSDDWLPPDAYSKLMASLLSSGSDVATGNVMRSQNGREWQGWNQTLTHAAIASPLTTTLAETPNLIFDTTAWNKVYRRQLLDQYKIRFPEGKLYEDMLPTARAYVAARRIDILPDTVYYYRIRNDKSSITQRRGELKNLADKVEMIRSVHSLLCDRNYPPEVVEVVARKALEGDLYVYSPFIGENVEFDSIYLQALRWAWGAARPSTIASLPLERRALYALQIKGEFERAAKTEAWIRNNFHEIPLLAVGSSVEVDVSYDPERLSILREPHLRDMSRYVALNQSVTACRIVDGYLELTGFAYLDSIPIDMPTEIQLGFVSKSGESIKLDWSPDEDQRADGYWRSGVGPNASRAFRVRQSVSELFEQAPAGSDWVLEVRVTSGEYTRSEPARGFWRGGAARLGTSATIDHERSAYLCWQPWQAPLTIRVRERAAEVTSVQVSSENAAVLQVAVSDAVDSIRAVRGRTQIVGEVNVDSGSTLASFSVGAMGRERSTGLADSWTFEYMKDNRAGVAHLSPDAFGGADVPTGWQLRVGTDGAAALLDQSRMIVIDAIEQRDGVWTLLGRSHYDWPAELEVYAENAEKKSYKCTLEVLDGRRIRITVPCAQGEGAAWSPGEYRIRARNLKWNKHVSGLRCTVAVVRDMPLEVFGAAAFMRWHADSDTLEPSLRVEAPLSRAERGRFNRLRMVREWRGRADADVAPLDAVLYSVDVGLGTGDSALAIMRSIESRAPGVSHYWAVENHSVRVPRGAIAVLRGSEKWFEIVNRSRLVVNNYGGLLGYNSRSFQRYIQTWHGTPLKTIGRSHHAQEDARWQVTKDERSRGEALEWDLFVSQSGFMTTVAREELFYSGEVLECGYPRNDELVNASELDKRTLRAQLGIESEKVLLYAPTWRDDGTGRYQQKMYDGLDLDRLVSELGSEWTVLLRGHSFNRRSGEADRSRGRIVDVTEWGSINQLMIASDALVTDYSSLMFDYLVTRKPIIFFAPDLDEYRATRGMYFQYEDVVSGPIVSSVDALAREVKNLARYGERFGDLYMEQVTRFVPWDDGSAAGRVVDWIAESGVIRGVRLGADESRPGSNAGLEA